MLPVLSHNDGRVHKEAAMTEPVEEPKWIITKVEEERDLLGLYWKTTLELTLMIPPTEEP